MPAFRVYVDCNSLYGDRLLTKPKLGQRLLGYVADGLCQLHLSPVVIGELSRQELEELSQHHRELDTRIKRIDPAHGDASQLLAQLQTFIESAEALIGARYQKLTEDGGVFIQPWPSYSGEEMVKRELANRRPFLKKEVGTIGHRDAVIWLGLVELARSFPDDTIFFITNDDGFKEGKQLHPELVAELVAAGVDTSHVKLYPQVHPVLEYLSTVELVVEDEDEDAGDERSDVPDFATWRAAITQALWEYNETVKEFSWSRTRSYDGDYDDPDWDIGLPDSFEDVQLMGIDGPFEVLIDPDQVTLDEPVVCTHQVSLSLYGFMEKFEWYGMEGYADFSLDDGDWNEHYVSLDAERTIQLKTKVIYDSSTCEASVEELEAVTVVLNCDCHALISVLLGTWVNHLNPQREVSAVQAACRALEEASRELAAAVTARADRAENALDAERAERRALIDRLTAVSPQPRPRNRPVAPPEKDKQPRGALQPPAA